MNGIFARSPGAMGAYQTSRPYDIDVVNFWERQALANGWTAQYNDLLNVFGPVGPAQGANPNAYLLPAGTIVPDPAQQSAGMSSLLPLLLLGAAAVALRRRRG